MKIKRNTNSRLKGGNRERKAEAEQSMVEETLWRIYGSRNIQNIKKDQEIPLHT